MISTKRYFFLVIAFSQLLACIQPSSEKLMIATAANMQFAMEEIVEDFEMDSGIPCEIILGSSGKLTAQIKEGAPFDIFVSANMKYPNDLYQSGLTQAPPTIYAFGKLVLWRAGEDALPSIDELQQADHIAIANPKTAPYGAAAIEVLQYYQLFTVLEKKLVYGESIAQTNQFIISGAAELGFTAKSVVLAPSVKRQGRWIDIDQNIYKPIEQGIVILKKISQQKSEDAQKFHDFLHSSKAREILLTFGYDVKE